MLPGDIECPRGEPRVTRSPKSLPVQILGLSFGLDQVHKLRYLYLEFGEG